MAIENTYLTGAGIVVAGGFDLQAKAPLDSRQTVPVYAGLAALVAGNACYEGMIVYVEEDKKTYQYTCTSVADDGTKNLEFVEFGFSAEDFAANVVDNLTSEDTNKALSAKQGKILKGMIEKIDTSLGGLTGAMRFIGVSTTDPMGEGSIVIEGKEDYTPADGDVIIFENAEFVYANGNWVELGDVSDEERRLTAIENIINDTEVEGETVKGLSSQVTDAVADASAAKSDAATAKANAQTALNTANEAKEAATTAQNSASASASAASNSASAAAGSAAAALASEEAAEAAQSAAEGAASTATNQAADAIEAKFAAESARDEAVTAQGAAEDHANTANEKAVAADNSAKAAATSESNAAANAQTAEGHASTATTKASEADTAAQAAAQAQAAAEQAKADAESAKQAALDSNTSATAIANAAKSEAEAATAASNAATQAVAGLHAIATSGSLYDAEEVGTAKNSAGEDVACLIFYCGSASELV